MGVLIAALLIVAFVFFVLGFVRKGPEEPSTVRWIAIGLALTVLALLLALDPFKLTKL